MFTMTYVAILSNSHRPFTWHTYIFQLYRQDIKNRVQNTEYTSADFCNLPSTVGRHRRRPVSVGAQI